jgi:hypothetical protein
MILKLRSPLSAVLDTTRDIVNTQTPGRKLEAVRLKGPLFGKVMPAAVTADGTLTVTVMT